MGIVNSIFFFNNILKIIRKNVLILPTPTNISIFWNFGFLLGVCIINQVISGLLLSFEYRVHIFTFFNLFHFIENSYFGWIFRYIHFNGASLFFILLFTHIARGLYYKSYKNKIAWIVGVFILILIIAVAFIGYVLPSNEISYWGSKVITGLFEEVPIFGKNILNFILGRWVISYKHTTTRFFAFHFVIPFVIIIFIFGHIIFLHRIGSSNPVGCRSKFYKTIFNMYSSKKDMFIFLAIFFFFFFFFFFLFCTILLF